MKYIASFGLIVALAFSPAYAAPSAGLYEVRVKDVENTVARALEQSGAAKHIEAKVRNAGNDVVYDYHKPTTLEVKTLRADSARKQYTANLFIMADGEVVSAMPISGSYQEMVEAPVLKRAMQNGEVVGVNDLTFALFPARSTRSDSVTDAEAIIGKSPVRSISSNRIIRVSELTNPSVVHKNDVVKMIYRASGMAISAVGLAMENGSTGDVISIKNSNSNRVVRGVITNHNEVEVSSLVGAPTLAQASENR